MSKVVLVCSRNPGEDARIQELLESLHTVLIPDNITPNATKVVTNGNARIAVINPIGVSPTHNGSVLLGHMVGRPQNWWKPGAPSPNGAFGLFRMDEDSIELVTDSLASRTIWYVKTDDIFVASTSQRAIVMVLGSFEPNDEAVVWMLSSGCLGPGNSWDARLSYVEPDTRLLFDRDAWSLRVQSRQCSFAEERLTLDEHKERLSDAVKYSLAEIDLDFSKFVLLLSGGLDSRALLMMLREKHRIQCVTWGLASSQKDTRNDAYLAKVVARHFDVPHQYFITDADKSNEPIDTIFHRFLVSGEGRVARISGYTDGFGIWKSLFEQNACGIVRGDMVFGNDPVSNEFDVRRLTRLTLFSDFCNLPDAASLDMPAQCSSGQFAHRPGESLETWRDRSYQTYTIPAMLAALTELKSSYVEVVNPLLSSHIVECVRSQPDSLRTHMKLWEKIVVANSPDIPFAETAAPARLDMFLKQQGVVDVMLAELESDNTPNIISRKMIEFINNGIQVSQSQEVKRNRFKRAVRPFVPRAIHDVFVRFRNKNELDINTLAFRAFVVVKMYEMLDCDATSHSHR